MGIGDRVVVRIYESSLGRSSKGSRSAATNINKQNTSWKSTSLKYHIKNLWNNNFVVIETFCRFCWNVVIPSVIRVFSTFNPIGFTNIWNVENKNMIQKVTQLLFQLNLQKKEWIYCKFIKIIYDSNVHCTNYSWSQ